MLDKYIRRSPRTASRIWGRVAVVVVPPKNNNLKEFVFEFGPDGAYIWKLLEGKPTIREIIVNFAKRKKIDFNSARKEVVKFIKQLVAEGLVEILDKIEK